MRTKRFKQKEVIPVGSRKQAPEETWSSIRTENSDSSNKDDNMFVIA